MSEEIKSFASQISELMFENTDKIPEGVYLQVMNKLKKVVDFATNGKTIIQFQNIDYRHKYLKENKKNIMLTAGLLHTLFKPIEENPNVSKYDYIDLNHCLNIKNHNGSYETHLLTDVLSVDFEGFYDLDADHAFIKSFMTTTCLRGNMLCLYTSNWQTTEDISQSRDYLGNYYVNDVLHYEYSFTRGEIGYEVHSSVDVFIKILKLNKKNMLVNIYIHVDVEKDAHNSERRAIKQAKVHMDYAVLRNINEIVPDEMTLGKVPFDTIFHKYFQTESQNAIKLDFEKIFCNESDIKL
jgi:hypothetical protein